MKKNIVTLAIGLAMTIICSCGNTSGKESISVTGADGTVYNSYQTACSKGDFDAARDYIGNMKEQYIVARAETDMHAVWAFEEAIQEAEAYVENEELQYLASLNEEQANNRIILILNQRAIDGLEAVENACLGKNVYEGSLGGNHSGWDDIDNFNNYIEWCRNHNSKCNTILNIAIACGNQNLAQKIIHCYQIPSLC